MGENPLYLSMIREIEDLMERHPGLDWTCACQSKAMEHGINEQELLEDMREHFA